MNIPKEDVHDLRYAKALLENPGMAAKIIALIGAPLEKGFALLPDKWSGTVHAATRLALEKALHVAVLTLGDGQTRPVSSNRLHKMIVAASGGMGGAFGLAALTVELPVSTTVMLRSIADIARSEGEHIREPEGQLACLEVFALGGRSPLDDSSETGYFAVRMGLAQAVSEAARHIAAKGVGQEGAPAVVRFITKVAARFSVTVSEKVAAQAVPVIGAAGGALINTLFLDHFQDMARGHFIVRRLERLHGRDKVKEAYDII
jgi:hypothetical protein